MRGDLFIACCRFVHVRDAVLFIVFNNKYYFLRQLLTRVASKRLLAYWTEVPSPGKQVKVPAANTAGVKSGRI